MSASPGIWAKPKEHLLAPYTAADLECTDDLFLCRPICSAEYDTDVSLTERQITAQQTLLYPGCQAKQRHDLRKPSARDPKCSRDRRLTLRLPRLHQAIDVMRERESASYAGHELRSQWCSPTTRRVGLFPPPHRECEAQGRPRPRAPSHGRTTPCGAPGRNFSATSPLAPSYSTRSKSRAIRRERSPRNSSSHNDSRS